MPVLDRDIRAALHRHLIPGIAGTDGRVVEEMGIEKGDARIDIAVVNGSLHGFEIKSEADTLRRLTVQAPVYSRVLDYVTLVCSPRHKDHALTAIPAWWGLVVYDPSLPDSPLVTVQERSRNPSPDPASVALLLWSDEMDELMAEHSLTAPKKAPRRKRATILASALPASVLSEAVRSRLKLRAAWRSDGPQP